MIKKTKAVKKPLCRIDENEQMLHLFEVNINDIASGSFVTRDKMYYLWKMWMRWASYFVNNTDALDIIGNNLLDLTSCVMINDFRGSAIKARHIKEVMCDCGIWCVD